MPAAVPLIGAGASLVGGLLNKKKGTSESTTAQFDPQSMDTFHQLNGQGAGVMEDYMKDPWNAGFFNNQLQQSNRAIADRAQASKFNLFNAANGVGGVSGGGVATGAVTNPNAFMASQMNALGRNTSHEKGDAMNSLLIGAENLRRGAAGAALSYKPLQIGSNVNQQGGGSMLGNILGTAGNVLTNLPSSGGGYHSSGAYNNGQFDPNQIVVGGF